MADIYSAIGLMSGTSLDGVDVAWIRTDGESLIEFKKSACYTYKADFKNRMTNLAKEDIS
jgi:anhydro-N-acetylmuramic acid kinase